MMLKRVEEKDGLDGSRAWLHLDKDGGQRSREQGGFVVLLEARVFQFLPAQVENFPRNFTGYC
jgi:hypothetical protein